MYWAGCFVNTKTLESRLGRIRNQLTALFPYDICSLNRYTTEGDCRRQRTLWGFQFQPFRTHSVTQSSALSPQLAHSFCFLFALAKFAVAVFGCVPFSRCCRLLRWVAWNGKRHSVESNLQKDFNRLGMYMAFTDTWHSRALLDFIPHFIT